jgi:hypothetical protein
VVAACTFVGLAYAAGSVTYHDLGVFHVNDQYVGPYDDSADRWWDNQMAEKSCGGAPDCWGRVAFVKSDGTWVASVTDQSADTDTFLYDASFQKKPLCKNDSAFTTYNAKCFGQKN